MAEHDRLLDDASIKGGSPADRIIGMLLERTEAMRELHASMRTEFRRFIDTNSDIQTTLIRITDRMEAHEKADALSFESIRGSVLALGAEVKASHVSLTAEITALKVSLEAATVAAVIQKAQVNAGWKVITVIGGIALAVISIFAIFYNHKP